MVRFLLRIVRQFIAVDHKLYVPLPRRANHLYFGRSNQKDRGRLHHLRVLVALSKSFFTLKPKEHRKFVYLSRCFGRFGNHVGEVALALHEALTTGGRALIVANGSTFRNGVVEILDFPVLFTSQDSFGRLGHSREAREILEDGSATIFSGAFFHDWIRNRYSLDFELLQRIYEELPKHLAAPLQEKLIGSNNLVVSIRGGNIFDEKPNSDYGQPPVSYYILCTTVSDPSHVWVLIQDYRNPVIGPYLAWLRESKIPHTVVEPGNETKHAELIFSAPNVVAPRSTFVFALASMSPFVEKLFFMGDSHFPFVKKIGVEIEDVGKQFSDSILSSNWAATPDQLKMMLNYPISNLRVRWFSNNPEL